jgi:biopolymer transport protein ExbD
MRKRRFYEAMEEADDGGLVNLTPLIDVVFVVLITFIIIAPLLKMDRISLAPSGDGKESVSPQEKSDIVLRVFSDDTVSLNEEKIRMIELLPKLTALHRTHPVSIPKVFQDQKATFGIYQLVKNTLEEAGYEEMDIILKPTK